LARFHDVWVLTHSHNRAAIEKGLQQNGSSHLHFCYLSLPGLLERLKSVQGGIQFYAYLWQLQAYFVARRLHRQVGFDLFHHATYANDWMASFIGAFLPVPYLRGPGGGAQRTPKTFLREYPFSARIWERFRSFGQWVLRRDPFFVRGQHRARVLLLCNREAVEAVPARLRHKVQLFPVNGIAAEDLRIFGAENGDGNQAAKPSLDGKGFPEGVFHVLSAGKLLSLKGYGLAIKAFSPFAKRHPDGTFTIVGDGPERAYLQRLVQHLGLERQVNLERWMPRQELLVLMRHCDTFLFPSFRDGGGAVVVEAMAAGKPVICMDLAGPGVHVTEECGIKIPAHSPLETTELIAQALERLYRNPELRVRMGEAARRRAEQMYTWDHLGERLQQIYEEVLGVKSPEA
jgi:glycosyltransferase involved in cell wall biosynthesis